MTKGWELCIEWDDGMITREILSDINSFPAQFVECDQGGGIIEEPSFEWWVPYILKKRKVILDLSTGTELTSMVSILPKMLTKN